MNTSDTSHFIEESLKDIQSSPVECLGKILERICRTVGCYGVILTFDERSNALAVDVVYGYQPEDAKKLRSERLKLRLEPMTSVSTEAFLEARNTGVANPKLVPGDDPLSHSITTEKMKEILGYAINSMGEWVGALTLESRETGTLEKLKNSESGRHWLEIFSAVLSMAFAARQSLVFRFDEFINQNEFRDSENLSHKTLDWVFKQFNVNSCAIHFIKYDDETGGDYISCMEAIVDRKYDRAAKKIRYDVGEGYAGWVAELQHSLILTEVENEQSKELDSYERDFKKRPRKAKKLSLSHPSLAFKSYIGVPISDAQETFGVLEVLDTERDYAFSDEGLLEMIARRIAAEHKRIFATIKRESLFEIPKLDTRSSETVIDGVVETAMKVAAATDGFFMSKEDDESFTPRSIRGHNLKTGDVSPTGPGEKNLVRWVMEKYKEVGRQDLKAERNAPPEPTMKDYWDNSFKPKGFIPEHMRSLLMVPVFLGGPHGYEDSAGDGGGAPDSENPSAMKVKDLGVLVLMSTKAKAFEQDDVVITALAQIVAYHMWANKKINELESRKAEISELRQLMPKYEHATIAAAVTSGTMHTVRNHVDNVKAAMDKLLSLDRIHGDIELRKLAAEVKKPFDELTNLYDRLFKNVFGGFEPRFEACDIAEQIQEARDYMEPIFRKRGVNFKSFLRETRLPRVKADSILMKVVFINFFKNSIEANARNITVRGKKVAGFMGRAMVELTFEDDGFGIPADSWKKVFKPFETAHKRGGTGLGLAVNIEIMDKHEGDAQVISSVIEGKDHGTVIAITLPVSN